MKTIIKDLAGVKKELEKLFSSQILAVIASLHQKFPYTNLVAFNSSHDLKKIYFATTRATRKFANIMANPQVSILIDNRSNQIEDFRWAMAVTATGLAQEVDKAKNEIVIDEFLEKHSNLEEFVQSPSTAFLEVKLNNYYIVKRFQNVTEIHITQ